jgi:ABC-type multidrug transport system ATPase subunit
MTLCKLTIKNLRVSYGKTLALAIEQLEIQGQIISIIGHNGSGKSTLIKTILDLLVPQQGSLSISTISEQDVYNLRPELDMAFSPENGAVFGDITVESYIKLWCRIKQRNANYYKHQGSDYIDRLEITPLLKKLGRELSKGQRRRVQTAVGFLMNPKLFLFDEPFDGLDIQQASLLSSIIKDESTKRAIIFSSHRMELVERLASNLIVLENGFVLSSGTVTDICESLHTRSVLISPANGTDNLANCQELLEKHLTNCIVYLSGQQIYITGKELSVDSLTTLINSLGFNNLIFQEIRPSLVDTIHLHMGNTKYSQET